MAKPLKPNGGESAPSVGDNETARDDLIKKLDSELRPLETKKAKISEDIKNVRQQFKADTGITLTDFDAGRRLAMIDDDEDRATKVSNIRRVYNLISPGESVDWVDAEGPPEQPSA